MKIVFMGSAEFAIPSLEKLLNSQHEVLFAVSTPDKERGRGRKVTFTPLKEFADDNGLEVLTPENLRDESFVNKLKQSQADLFVVVAFRILPKELLQIPKRGSINLHASLLPKYRGAAPIHWALINGEKETGVTTFFLDEKVDTGNIILQEKIKIDDEDNLGSLYDKLKILGADVLIKTVDKIDNGFYELMKQDNSLATPAPKITKEICKINLQKSAVEIHNLVRGLSPHPGAILEYKSKYYKILKTKIVQNFNSQILETIQTTKKEIYLKTSDGILQILELQPEGRKKMSAEEFLRGYSFDS